MVARTLVNGTLYEHCLSCYLSEQPPVTFCNRQPQRWSYSFV